VGVEGALEYIDTVGARVAVPGVREAGPIDHLEDHHPGRRVVHERYVLQVGVDVVDGEELHLCGVRVDDGQLDRLHRCGHRLSDLSLWLAGPRRGMVAA
jgi:hypothetical protein